MASVRTPLGELATLADADDLDGTVDGTQDLDLTGAAGCIIVAQNIGTDGTAGQDVIEISRDDGETFLAATADNIGQGHDGLMLEDGAAAAAVDAELNATAGTEVNAVFSLGPLDGPAVIRCARGGTGAGGIAWVTGAPEVVAIRIG